MDKPVIVIEDCDLILSFRNNITHVSMMSDLRVRATMLHTLWIEVRASSLTTFNEVSELMNVEAVRAFSEVLHLSMDMGLLSLSLSELAEP